MKVATWRGRTRFRKPNVSGKRPAKNEKNINTESEVGDPLIEKTVHHILFILLNILDKYLKQILFKACN